ncbi:MAG: hypothetical protein GY884_21015 [Proteobacteria bacterium]|nr:hypothetical protein [Pseudomonadota bacterium]
MIALIALLACNKDDPSNTDGTQPDDSDPVVETDSGDVEECLVVPLEITPEDQDTGVYYRDKLVVSFTGPAPDASFTLATTDDGEDHAPTLIPSWNDSDEQATLTVQGYLQANRDYALTITVCDEAYTSTFSTDLYGGDLSEDRDQLVDRVYLVELDEVTFTEPEGFGAFISLYLDVPILIGVQAVEPDGTAMDLIGAQGRLKNDGTYTQKYYQTIDEVQYHVPTWPFPDADFNGSPFFSGESEKIELRYDGAFVPVYDFHIEGTFAPDGSSFGGGRLWGLGDTADMASLFGEADDPYYVCELVAGAGAECEVCPESGEKTCLFLKGENITAEHLDYIEGIVEQDDSPTSGG